MVKKIITYIYNKEKQSTLKNAIDDALTNSI